MIALEFKNVKAFTNALFIGNIFDIFLLEEARFQMAVTYTIEGRINESFYTAEEKEAGQPEYAFLPWKEAKGIAVQMIKGNRTPLRFQIVLQLMPVHVASILHKGGSEVAPNLIKSFVANIRYEEGRITVITGTSMTTFLPDKEPERLWDAALKKYLSDKGLEFEEL